MARSWKSCLNVDPKGTMMRLETNCLLNHASGLFRVKLLRGVNSREITKYYIDIHFNK